MFAEHLGAALAERGYRVDTCAISGSVELGALSRHSRSRFSPRILRQLARRAQDSDLVIVHGSDGLLPTFVVGCLTGVHYVYRNIGDPRHWSTVPLSSLRIGAPLRRAEQVIALSPDIARWIIEHFDVPADRVSVIPNAVDVAAFPPRDPAARSALRSSLGLDDDAFVLGYLGALSTEKRPMLAIEAVAARPGAHLLLAGDGPLRSTLEEAAATLAPGRVHLLGAVRRPADMLSAVDGLLLPSQTEGMPASLIEAALVGAPVVATAVGAVPELVAELGCGTVVPAEEPSAFVQAVKEFQPADFDMAAARVAAAQYDIAAVVDRWVDVLRNAPRR